MGEFFTYIREFNTVSVVIRMVLAVLCGGIIGVEREHKRRPAGFRTHTLVCLGASLAVLTSQSLLTNGWNTDPARLGAQVVAGIGFIGAGTIIVTRLRQVKGLTTAAGLWVSAIIGLSIGAGFYEAGLIATLLVIVAELLLSKLEWYISSKSKNINIYIEYAEDASLAEIAETIKNIGVSIVDIEITRRNATENSMLSAIFALQLGKVKRENLMMQISETKGVFSVEEL